MKQPIGLAALLTVGLFLVSACFKSTAKSAADGPAPQKPEEVQGWSYGCQVSGKGSRSEGRRGYLCYRQKMLVAPVGTVVSTPTGKFLFFGGYDIKGWGEHGWHNEQCYGRPVFDSNGLVRKDLADEFLHSNTPIHELTIAELLKLNRTEPDKASEPTPPAVTPPVRREARQP